MALNVFRFQKGKTSQRVQVLLETASTANSGKTNLAFGTASLTCYYFRDGDTAPTQITLVDGVSVGHAWTSGGFIKVSDSLMPGIYDFGIPDAVLATGANWAWIWFGGSAAFTTQSPQVFIELTGHDQTDGVRQGMTALPNAAAGAAGGLLTCTSANVLPAGAIVASSINAGASPGWR